MKQFATSCYRKPIIFRLGCITTPHHKIGSYNNTPSHVLFLTHSFYFFFFLAMIKELEGWVTQISVSVSMVIETVSNCVLKNYSRWHIIIQHSHSSNSHSKNLFNKSWTEQAFLWSRTNDLFFCMLWCWTKVFVNVVFYF